MVKRILFAVLCLGIYNSAWAAQATIDTPTHRGGQSFVTWTEVAGGGITYSVYRSTSQITTLSGLTAITGFDQDSGRLLYDDSLNPFDLTPTGSNLTSGFIIADGGSHLASNKGLYVHTTATSGCYYYAVTNSGDSSITVGTNSLTTCVTETYQAVPGAIFLRSDTTTYSGRTLHFYYAWENYLDWRTSEWGYYGFEFSVLMDNGLSTAAPMYAQFHAAPGAPYNEPYAATGWPTGFVHLTWVSDDTGTDAYAGTALGWDRHTGRLDSVTGLFMTYGVNRIARYIQLVRDNATGDGRNFHIDSNRIYSTGGSGGSFNALFAVKHPELIVSSEAQIGFSENASYHAEPNETTVHVNTAGGPTIKQYFDYETMAASGVMPPILHTPGSNDSTVVPDHYPESYLAFETYHQPYATQWSNSGHSQFLMSSNGLSLPTYSHWVGYRFLRNESYPAFSSTANSDTPEATDQWDLNSTDPPGQRNAYMDWDSSLHDLGSGTGANIYDHSWEFRMSFKSTSGSNTTSTITIRNQQNFTPAAGTPFAYFNVTGLTGVAGVDTTLESGTGTVSTDGSITIASLSIRSAGNRLTIFAGGATTDLYNKSWADYSELSVCGNYGTSIDFGGNSWTIATTTTATPGSSNNFKLYRDGVWTTPYRGFVYVVESGVLSVLNHQGKWYQWNGSAWSGPVFQETVGCRLPVSTDGTTALLNNTYISDALGGTWFAACSEAPGTYGYGLYCPDFDGSTLERGIIIRNGARFPEVPASGKRSLDEPNNTPWNLKYCNGEVYLLEYNANPLIKAYTKWAGPGVATWTDATGSACLSATANIITDEGFSDAAATCTSVQAGAWSTTSTWSCAREPLSSDWVKISHAVTISGTRNAWTIYVAAGGSLTCNGAGSVTFSDTAYESGTQFYTGMLVLGTFNCVRPTKTPWARTTAGISNGATTITVDACTGWAMGDSIVIGDTREPQQLFTLITDTYHPEVRTISSIAGCVITLSSAVGHAYTTARDHNGTVERYIPVGNLTRDFVFSSPDAATTRAHIMFNSSAIIDMEYVEIHDIGRTDIGPLDPVTNHIGRYSLHLHKMGVTTAIIKGNSVYDTMQWGYTVHNTDSAQIIDNVAYNTRGWGFGTESGSETDNLFQGNLSILSTGSGNYESGIVAEDNGNVGTGFWMQGPHNCLIGNVGMNNEMDGFQIWDFVAPADYLRCFKDNEAIANNEGFSLWKFGQFDRISHIDHFMEWHNYHYGFYQYGSANAVFTDFYSRSDPNFVGLRSADRTQNWFGDYDPVWGVFLRPNIQNKDVGFYTPYGISGPQVSSGERVVIVVDAYFYNTIDVLAQMNGLAGGAQDVRTEFINPVHDNASGTHYEKRYLAAGDATKRNRIRVTNYQNTVGDNFEVFGASQDPSVHADQTNSIGGSQPQVGCPTSGKTNQQCYDTHGISIYGQLTPVAAHTRARMNTVCGFYCTGSETVQGKVLDFTITQGTSVTDTEGAAWTVNGSFQAIRNSTNTTQVCYYFVVSSTESQIYCLGADFVWRYWTGGSGGSWTVYSLVTDDDPPTRTSWGLPPDTHTLPTSSSGTFIRNGGYLTTPYAPFFVDNDKLIWGALNSPATGTLVRTGWHADAYSEALPQTTNPLARSTAITPWSGLFCSDVVWKADNDVYATRDADQLTWTTSGSAPSCTLGGGAPSVGRPRLRKR